MKILQLTMNLGNGGAEKFAVELSNELSSNNEVIFCTIGRNTADMLLPKVLNNNIITLSLGSFKKISLYNVYSLYKCLKRVMPDIVHIHSSAALLNLLPLTVFFTKIKFYHTIHSTLTPAYIKLFKIIYYCLFFRKKINNVCISKTICEKFSGKYPNLKFSQVDNGIQPVTISRKFKMVINEIDTYKPKVNTKVLISLGNYTAVKRFDMLMEIMAEMHEKEIILLILGEDTTPDKRNFKQVLEKKPPNVFLLGLKSNPGDYVAASDALVISSQMEGMPLVALEAMSLGKTIITSPAGGLVDIVIDKINGFIAKDLTKCELIHSINDFLAMNINDIKVLEERAKIDFLKKFHMKVCSQKYLELYYSN